MHLRILGCHGGESPSHRATSFLIDDRLVLDVGSLTRGLTVDQQLGIDAIFVSHCHLDHVRDLGLVADNLIGRKKEPVEVYCTDATAEALEKYYFNNFIWPDFTKIPNPLNPEVPILRINRFDPVEGVEVLDTYTIRGVPVNHPVENHALFVSGPTGTIVYCGDTGPTDILWESVNQVENLRAIICEVSFTNNMAKIAEAAGHLTPELLKSELEKFQPVAPNPQILLYGMKPGFAEPLKDEVAALGDKRLVMLKIMDEFNF